MASRRHDALLALGRLVAIALLPGAVELAWAHLTCRIGRILAFRVSVSSVHRGFSVVGLRLKSIFSVWISLPKHIVVKGRQTLARRVIAVLIVSNVVEALACRVLLNARAFHSEWIVIIADRCILLIGLDLLKAQNLIGIVNLLAEVHFIWNCIILLVWKLRNILRGINRNLVFHAEYFLKLKLAFKHNLLEAFESISTSKSRLAASLVDVAGSIEACLWSVFLLPEVWIALRSCSWISTCTIIVILWRQGRKAFFNKRIHVDAKVQPAISLHWDCWNSTVGCVLDNFSPSSTEDQSFSVL